MREEIDSKFDAILREIKTSKNPSTITNPRSESKDTRNTQPSGSGDSPIGVHASENDNSDSEIEDSHPIRASNMHELRNPARPFCQNRFELDETIFSNPDSEEEDYHSKQRFNVKNSLVYSTVIKKSSTYDVLNQ